MTLISFISKYKGSIHTPLRIIYPKSCESTLFICASVKSAKTLAMNFSLMRTLRQHHPDPYKCYVEILRVVLHCNSTGLRGSSDFV